MKTSLITFVALAMMGLPNTIFGNADRIPHSMDAKAPIDILPLLERFYNPYIDATFDANRPTYWDGAAIKDRFETMDTPFDVRLTYEIEQEIKSYINSGYRGTEGILGRGELYFPIFEHYLEQYDLPLSLKYLPVIESALQSRAGSSAGARGLWQFMSPTARQYGLAVNNYVDERQDIHKASAAAAQHLAKQYNRFGSWELALASYNCGAGNVYKAIRMAGGQKDFWKIRRYLPRETREYVPRYIAACYVMENYFYHDLMPQYPDFDLQFTRTIKIYNYTSFVKLSKITGIDIETLKKLNPAFRRNVIPTNSRGYLVTLPDYGVSALEDNLSNHENPTIKTNIGIHRDRASLGVPNDYIKSSFIVGNGDTLERIARLFELEESKLQQWNGLSDSKLYYGQKLVIFLPSTVLTNR